MELSFNNRALTAIASGLLGAGMAGVTQANVLATSFIEQTNLLFYDNATNTVLDFDADFSGNLTFTSTADADVSLTGFGSDGFTGFNPPTNPINLNPPLCVGPGCNPLLPDNSYPVLTGPAGSTYSAADQSEFGAPITGVPATGGGVFSTPADVGNGAYVGIDDSLSAQGSANANNNLNSSFVFTVVDPVTVRIDFDARGYLEAYVESSEEFPGFATAAYEINFTLANLTAGGTPIFEWSPDGIIGTGISGGIEIADDFDLTHTVSVNAPVLVDIKNTGGIHTPGVASSGFFSATGPVLQPGVQYQLSARNNANADASRVAVPEPSLIFLTGVGLGLLGIGSFRKRRKMA